MSWIRLQPQKPGPRRIGGIELQTVSAPRPDSDSLWKVALGGLKGMLGGMKLTLGYVTHPSKVVTQQYPENRETLKLPERARGRLYFVKEENGFHRCTACRICERACPNESIIIHAHKGEVTKKPEIDHYVWRLDTCTFCYACVQTCPFDAIRFDGRFESAVYDRRLLVYNLNDYAGPHDTLARKIEDEEQRASCRTPVRPYEGPVPASGEKLHGIEPLGPPRGEDE